MHDGPTFWVSFEKMYRDPSTMELWVGFKPHAQTTCQAASNKAKPVFGLKQAENSLGASSLEDDDDLILGILGGLTPGRLAQGTLLVNIWFQSKPRL